MYPIRWQVVDVQTEKDGRDPRQLLGGFLVQFWCYWSQQTFKYESSHHRFDKWNIECFEMKMLWFTLSNAYFKHRNTAPTTFPLSSGKNKWTQCVEGANNGLSPSNAAFVLSNLLQPRWGPSDLIRGPGWWSDMSLHVTRTSCILERCLYMLKSRWSLIYVILVLHRTALSIKCVRSFGFSKQTPMQEANTGSYKCTKDKGVDKAQTCILKLVMRMSSRWGCRLIKKEQ